MDFQLPEELRMLKDQLRRFVDTQMIPVERETCEGQELKPEYRQKFESHIKDMGLWMMDVPAEFGGGDMGLLACVVVWQELARTIALPSRGGSILGPNVRAILYSLEGEMRRNIFFPFCAERNAPALPRQNLMRALIPAACARQLCGRAIIM